MLVLSRKMGERVFCQGPCEIVVERIESGRVKLGFIAPKSVKIKRAELMAPRLVDSPGRKCVRRWWKMAAEKIGKDFPESLATA